MINKKIRYSKIGGVRQFGNKMIIDSHVHMGSFAQINMPVETILQSMEKYAIDFSLVSNGSGVEVDHEQKLIPMEKQI